MQNITSPTLLALRQREKDINEEFEERMFQLFKAITKEYHEIFFDLYKVPVNTVDITDPKTQMERDAYWVIHRKEYDIKPGDLIFGQIKESSHC